MPRKQEPEFTNKELSRDALAGCALLFVVALLVLFALAAIAKKSGVQ